MRGRPKAGLVLSEAEREQLQTWSRRRKTAPALALRSRIVLGRASGTSTTNSARHPSFNTPVERRDSPLSRHLQR
jgi:hypothetical protein